MQMESTNTVIKSIHYSRNQVRDRHGHDKEQDLHAREQPRGTQGPQDLQVPGLAAYRPSRTRVSRRMLPTLHGH